MLKKGWKALKKKMTVKEEHDDFCLCSPCQNMRAALKEKRNRLHREEMARRHSDMIASGQIPPSMQGLGIRSIRVRPPADGRPGNHGRGGKPMTENDRLRLLLFKAELDRRRAWGIPEGARREPQGGAAFGGAGPSGPWGARPDGGGAGRGGARPSGPGRGGGGGGLSDKPNWL